MILRASSNGQALEVSAISRKDAAWVSMVVIDFSRGAGAPIQVGFASKPLARQLGRLYRWRKHWRQNGLIGKYRSQRSVKRPCSHTRNSAQFNASRIVSLPLRTAIPTPSPKNRLSIKGPPRNAQQFSESV